MTDPSSLQELKKSWDPAHKSPEVCKDTLRVCEARISKRDPCRKMDITGKSSVQVHSWNNHLFLNGTNFPIALCDDTHGNHHRMFPHALLSGRRSPFWCHHPKMEYLTLGGGEMESPRPHGYGCRASNLPPEDFMAPKWWQNAVDLRFLVGFKV